MSYILRHYFIVIIIALLCVPVRAKAQEPSFGIAVLASSSLSDVMTELARIYSKEKHMTISSFFDSPETLADTIRNGEAADMYISEDPALIQDLKQRGLIDVFSLTTLASNRLVLATFRSHHLARITPPGTPLKDILKDINEKSLLVMANPDEVFVGKEARTVLEKLGEWDNISPFLIRTPNTRSALFLIGKGNGAGIVYYTDALQNDDVIIMADFPGDLYEPIIYHAAVVAGDNMPVARDFLTFLKSEKAKTIFQKYGFLVY